MKSKNLLSCVVQWAFLSLLLLLNVRHLQAEAEIETLYTFTGPDGSCPSNLVQLPNGEFYGTTCKGGDNDMGTIFRLPITEHLIRLVSFNGINGTKPSSRLLPGLDGNLYGTTESGGAYNHGTVFMVSPDGNFKSLFSFDGLNGCCPEGNLLLTRDGTIYGCTKEGGSTGAGTIFAITPDKTCRTVATFNGTTDGGTPEDLSRGEDGIYGTTSAGGASGEGTIFKLTPGGQLTTLYSFNDGAKDAPVPHLSQLQDGSWYGTTKKGGADGDGSIYIMPAGGKLQNYVTFDGANGSHPGNDMVKWNNGYFYMQMLYDNIQVKSHGVQFYDLNFVGTTMTGGQHGNGTVYELSKTGRIYTVVSFGGKDGKNQGAFPSSLMAGIDGNLYGTTAAGGNTNQGTIYRLRLENYVPPSDSTRNVAVLGITLNLPPLVSP